MRSRRAFLTTGLRTAAGLAVAPAVIKRAAARPGIPYDSASGDVTRDRAIVWSGTDRPARLLVEWSTTESFQASAPRARAGGDGGHRLHRARRPDGTSTRTADRYRVQFEDLGDFRNLSVPVSGSFQAAPQRARPPRLGRLAEVARRSAELGHC